VARRPAIGVATMVSASAPGVPCAPHRAGLGRVVRPQQHVVACGQRDRERRAPGAGTEDRDLHAPGRRQQLPRRVSSRR